MHVRLTSDRQRYYLLMALVCDDLIEAGAQSITTLVRGGHEASASELTAVRVGRKPHVAWLIDIVRVALPKFSIPEEVQPIAPAAAGVGMSLVFDL